MKLLIIGFVVGLFVGATLGIICMGLMSASAYDDRAKEAAMEDK